jgi:competence protein ComGF
MLEDLATKIFGSIYTNMDKDKKSGVTIVVGILLFFTIFLFLASKKDFIEDGLLLIAGILFFVPQSRAVLKGFIPSSQKEAIELEKKVIQEDAEKSGSLQNEEY